MIRIALACLALGLASSGCATMADERMGAEDPAIGKKLAGLAPGKAQSCIPLTDSQNGQKFSETVLYRVGRNLTYRADIPGCTELKDDDIMVLNVYGSQLCRGDIFRLVDRVSGFERGACVFRDFVPYRKPG